jgi:poly-gamma-glutamate capsule biosynthesis protein CapA/YwtB (metallophosphatase superfamily)
MDRPPRPRRPGAAGQQKNHVTLALTGDVMLGRLVDQALAAVGPSHPWGDALPLLRAADLTLVNLECAIATGGAPWARTPKVFHFRTGLAGLYALQAAGVDCVYLANNHVLDYEVEGLLETLANLDAGGIARVGGGRDLAEAAQPALLEAGGVRVGVLSCSDNEPGWAAGAATPGINYLPVSKDEAHFQRVREGIAAARATGADLVIFANHWGPNMRLRPPADFREFAHAVVDAGADIYVGHSAHVLQGVEYYRGRPIFYDLGDFVDDYAVDPDLRNDLSALVLLTVGRQGLASVELLPVRIDACQVNLATGPDFEAIATRLIELSGELGTAMARRGERLAVLAPRRAPPD